MKGEYTLALDFGGAPAPLVVCYGMGRDSTALLVGLQLRRIRPDAILFADVGAERQATYNFLPVINDWLSRVGFPFVTVVRYRPKNYKHWPPYHSLEENILTNVALPSIAYGGHSCSSKWKIEPQNAWLAKWPAGRDAWSRGLKVRKMIGFEDSPHEHRPREKGCATFAIQADEVERYTLEYPLQEWGWNLERSVSEIMQAGLPVPPKSSCYFCTAMKPAEIDELALLEPAKLRRLVIIEARTTKRHADYADARRAALRAMIDSPASPPAERTKAATLLARTPLSGPLTHGLWRKPVKGLRGAQPRPGSMTEYIRARGLVPAGEIDALIALTPQHHVTAEDFARAGVRDWQDWIARICADAAAATA